MSGGAPASAGPTTDLQPAQGAGDRRKDLKSSAPWEACMSMHIPVGTTALATEPMPLPLSVPTE